MADTQVGFVGIGNMGAPMVKCLLKAGFKVTAFDANPSALKQFADTPGVQIAAGLKSLASTCPVVITMLPDSKIVRRAVLGNGDAPSLADGLQRDSIVIDMSSSFAPDTVRLGADLSARGVGLVDAPVSGGVGKAVTGTLAIMTGGDNASVDRVAKILAAMGTVHRTGALGSGHALKALNNYVSAAGLIATCEALTVGKAFGLDPVIMTRVINASTGRNNTTENKAERYLIPAKYDSGFALALMSKDVGMAHALSEEVGVAADELEFVTSYLKRAAKSLGTDADHTAVMAYVNNRDDA
jgi:3-hydroxyisobutyrate dehydrogenase